MAAFLLWNVNGKSSLDGLAQELVRQHDVLVALLVEYPRVGSLLPTMLLSDDLVKRRSPPRFGVFVHQDHEFARLRFRTGSRVGMWRWTHPSGVDGLVTLTHGLDRRNYDDSTRRVFFRGLRTQSASTKRKASTHDQSSPGTSMHTRLNRPSSIQTGCMRQWANAAPV